jgi:hypothetical protein
LASQKKSRRAIRSRHSPFCASRKKEAPDSPRRAIFLKNDADQKADMKSESGDDCLHPDPPGQLGQDCRAIMWPWQCAVPRGLVRVAIPAMPGKLDALVEWCHTKRRDPKRA